MGQFNLLKSQRMINGPLGQIGFEVYGLEVIYSKDLTQIFPNKKVAMRLAILDPAQYGDYDILPLPPEYETQIIEEVFKLYMQQPTAGKIVDATVKEDKSFPVNTQKQSG